MFITPVIFLHDRERQQNSHEVLRVIVVLPPRGVISESEERLRYRPRIGILQHYYSEPQLNFFSGREILFFSRVVAIFKRPASQHNHPAPLRHAAIVCEFTSIIVYLWRSWAWSSSASFSSAAADRQTPIASCSLGLQPRQKYQRS